MTRINCVPVEELTGKHLVAEYRELPRVFGLVRRHVAKGGVLSDIEIADEYLLGTGHVRFFYDKLLWLSWRHLYLVEEMERRGYKPNFTENLRVTFADIPSEYWNDWQPREQDLLLNRGRIKDRLG